MVISYDIEKINAALEDFYKATDINMNLLKADFSFVGGRSHRENNRYCEAIQHTTKGKKECEDILQVLQNICEQNFKDIKGYYIYFEKNSAMEEYISHCSIKSDTNVIGEARKRDNKNIASGNKKSINIIKGKLSPVMAMQVLNMVSLGILIICCIIAVTTLNQYDKMKQLEETVNYLEISMEEQKNLPED